MTQGGESGPATGHGSTSLPRRRFLRALGGAGLGATAIGAAISACSAGGLAPYPLPRPAPDRSRAQRVVTFANWVNYIDNAPGDPARHPTLEEFTGTTGIKVAYSQPITGNEPFLGEIGTRLAMGWRTGYDLVVLSDWVVYLLVQLGWAHPLSLAAVPNATRLLPQFRDWPIPDARRYCLPWQCGFTGIVYNLTVTHRPVTTMADLLTAPDLHGKVSLSTDMRDVLTLVMLDLGIDPATFTPREFAAALAMVSKAAQSGQIKTVTNYYGPALIKGSLAACVGYAGDVLGFRTHHPDIFFTWPKAGGLIWSDNMVIPQHAPHTGNAEQLMNFYYQPYIAAQLSAYQQYMCPVLGAQEAMRHINTSLAAEKYIFPDPGILRNAYFFKNLTPAQNAHYIASYQTALGL